MDFHDRFRDRTALLTKNGLLTILDIPSNPIPKSNTPFYIPPRHAQFQPSDLHYKKPPSNVSLLHNSNNSGTSLLSRPSNSRQSISGVQSNRVSPQNVFLMARRTGLVRTPSTRESSRGTQTRRNVQQETYNSKGLEGENGSFMLENKYSRCKNRSLEAGRRNSRDMDFVLEDHLPIVEKSYRERSREGKENIREFDHNIIKNAIDSVERLQLRGTHREILNNNRELEGYEGKSNVKVRVPLSHQNVNLERSPLTCILPQLEKVQDLNMGSIKSVLMSFRERESQAAGHINRYTRKIQVSAEGRKPLKSKSLEKLLVLKDKDQLENFKLEFIKKEEERKDDKSPMTGRLRMPSTEREKRVIPETERVIKKVSFKEEMEVLTVRGNTRQKERRRLIFKDDGSFLKEEKEKGDEIA